MSAMTYAEATRLLVRHFTVLSTDERPTLSQFEEALRLVDDRTADAAALR